MAHTIQVVTTVKINGTQVTSLSRSIAVEATDSIEVDLPGGTSNEQEVEVQPTSTSGRVSFLAITADRYDALLTYSITSGSPTTIAVDQPHVLVGEGAVGLLNPAASHPTSLFFKNGLAENVRIQILVGRDATPP
ncbi:MAG: hypothetical protein JSW39_18715 [Desulfobacterales bacterium]|nr:MAG: hypothetical protein JSW39_18715 [Desulfobacterales bacterium]